MSNNTKQGKCGQSNAVAHQVHIFFNALAFLTRLPCPSWVIHSSTYQSRAAPFFPLVGWIVGAIAAGVFRASALFLPLTVAIVLSMIASVWITGAFHEDGFGDVCDGFGGGWNAAQIKAIMKDSRMGAFGVIGLSLVLLLKFVALVELAKGFEALGYTPAALGGIIIAGHSLSRFAAVSFLYTQRYTGVEGSSKSGSVTAPLSTSGFLCAAGFGVAPLLMLPGLPYTLFAVVPVALSRAYLARLFAKRLGGYSGDCLGCVQQVTEVVFYLGVCVVVYRYTIG